MSLSFHLSFNGDCQAAFEYYAAHLQGEIDFMLPVKDSPLAHTYDAHWQHKILHAAIRIQGVEFSGSDVVPEHYQRPAGFHLLLGLESAARVEAVFAQLSRDGEITMHPQKTFWSPCYAIVTDRFGVPWKLNGRA